LNKRSDRKYILWISGYFTPRYAFPATFFQNMYVQVLFSKVCISGYLIPKYVFPATLLQCMYFLFLYSKFFFQLIYSKVCISRYFTPKYVFSVTSLVQSFTPQSSMYNIIWKERVLWFRYIIFTPTHEQIKSFSLAYMSYFNISVTTDKYVESNVCISCFFTPNLFSS
jgi:hypothetical protein